MLTVWPLLTLTAVTKPSALMLMTSVVVRELITPLKLALLKASSPALVSQSPRSPLAGLLFHLSRDVAPLSIEK